MPKKAKKTAAKKTAAKAAKKKTPAKKTTAKPAPARPAAVRARTVTATPARVISRRRGGKSVITAVIGSVITDEIALRAYYIGERRIRLGLGGDSESDWLEAERQLRR
ncbi:MAG: DUF2934 domain-containing protein [Chthoniobacterales bacterium]|nr:DUF2934 domain-containing protein [Chthoniobacterales bacterium]